MISGGWNKNFYHLLIILQTANRETILLIPVAWAYIVAIAVHEPITGRGYRVFSRTPPVTVAVKVNEISNAIAGSTSKCY